MKLATIFNQARHEINALQGEEVKHRTYSSQRDLTDVAIAQQVFDEAIRRLFDVNAWSSISSFTAEFVLHNADGYINQPAS
jgi:hypothetical protein